MVASIRVWGHMVVASIRVWGHMVASIKLGYTSMADLSCAGCILRACLYIG